jgi:type 1 glutamine amidotransferase
MKRFLKIPVVFFALASITVPLSAESEEDEFAALVFSRTEGFRHGSIEIGQQTIAELGTENGFRVEATEDSAWFTAERLADFEVVVFLNTTGTVLDADQKAAFEAYIENGGGYVGIHSAADTEYEWEWYGRLVGAYFRSHPQIQEAVIKVENREHPSTAHLEEEWVRTDEWYNFRQNPRDSVNVLLSLDTGSFEGSSMMDDHPIAWYHQVGEGRSYYTGLGHTNESYGEEAFRTHLVGALRWAAGKTE